MAITSHDFEVKHTTDDGEEISYIFKSASFADEAALGMLERGVRRDIERKLGIGNAMGDPYGLDDHTYLMTRAVAVFQVLLKSCSSDWPYKKGPTGEFAGVDYNEWDSQYIETAIAVYLLYSEQVLRFRNDRRKPAASGSPVASSPNPEPQPV